MIFNRSKPDSNDSPGRSFRLPSIQGAITTLGILVLSVVTALVLFNMYSAKIAAGLYKSRLAELNQEYYQLQSRYNDAVKKTAITELAVVDGKLSVVIRTVQGVIKTIATPFDPDKEIHVDYLVTKGRLWIRRIHDSSTPPDKALVIDPALGQIEWENGDKDYGLVIYKVLGEGRWVVSATRNGALAMKKLPFGEQVALASPPRIMNLEEIDAQVNTKLDSIGPIDVVKWLFGKDGQAP
jgi:hypothetical protein